MTPDQKPILILAGPTAVGKTDASILLAREQGAEIVSADSMQIYRSMDIGTAKPTREQRSLVYHHMIDAADPDQPYSVGDYLRDARSAIDGIVSSGGTPIVVGGTGLYIRALTRGLFHGPPADLELRERLLRRDSEDPGRLYSDLVEADPEAAVKIHPNDLRRTVRALEVFHLRERKLSDFHREHAFSDSPYKFHLLFLVRSRSELYPRIEKRVDQMVADGLEAEVKSLMDRGYRADLPSLQGLGYQHFLNLFKGTIKSREEAIALLKRDTKRYAKRQFTWFRRESSAIWVDITGLSNPSEIVARIKKSIDISNNLV